MNNGLCCNDLSQHNVGHVIIWSQTDYFDFLCFELET